MEDLQNLILSSKKHLESIFDAITDPIIIIGKDYTIQRINLAASKLLNENFKDILGQPCYSKFNKSKDVCSNCPMEKIFLDKKSGSFKLKKEFNNSLKIYDVRYFPLEDKNGNVEAIVEHYVDITSGELAKDELQDSYEKIKSELNVAKRIQHKLLPSKELVVPGMDVNVIYKAAEDVSGDLFDIFTLDSENTGLLIADVAGHGIPAALIGAMAKMSLYNHTSKNFLPENVLEKVNKDLYNNLMAEFYITGAYFIFNTLSNKLTFSRAGHPETLLLDASTGEVKKLGGMGYFLGLMENGNYDSHEVYLNKGDRLLFYTDGITEVIKDKEQFGEKRLIEMLEKTSTLSLEQATKEILKSVEEYGGTTVFPDDITLILTEVNSSNTIETFQLQKHFSREHNISIKKLLHPLDFNKCIETITTELQNNQYSIDDCNDMQYGIYDALDMFLRSSPKASDGLYIAYQIKKSEMRIVITDSRFFSKELFTDTYKNKFQDIFKSLDDKFTRTLFPDGGRKIILFKKNQSE